MRQYFETKADYFDFSPAHGVRIVQLDTFQISTLLEDSSAERKLGDLDLSYGILIFYTAAFDLLEKENPASIRGVFKNIKFILIIFSLTAC